MKKLGSAVVLAAATGLGGAAWGQTITISGETTPASPRISFFPTGDDRLFFQAFEVTINDGAGFVLDVNRGTAPAVFGYFFTAAGGITSFSERANGANASEDPDIDMLLRGEDVPFAPGQYILVIETDIDFGTFTADLTGITLGWGPSGMEELAGLLAASGGAARIIVVDAAGVARDLGQVSIATRDAAGGFVRAVDGSVTRSSQSGPSLAGNLYTWAELRSFRSTEDGGGAAEIGGSGLRIGADVAIGSDMVAGLSLGYSEITASDGAFRQEGELVYLQPYFSYRSGPWQGNASVIYGWGSFDQSSAGGDGSAEVTLTAVTFEGGYDVALADGVTLTPTLGLIHGEQEIEGTGGTLSGTETLRFSQGSLGARITFDGSDGSLFAGVHADYLTQDAGLVLADDLLAQDGWTGRVELGGSTALGHGLALDTSVEVSGIGSGMETLSGGLRVAFRF